MKSKKEYIERERKMSDNIEQNITIKELVTKTEVASTDFEKNNTELKRKYLVWNIEAFNCIALAVSANKGSFGTGYPFYALDKDLKGNLPIIQEQIRYNRELVRDGEPFQKSIWLCESCLKTKYSEMPDLKKICKPCPNMNDKLKPRKIINRLPDLDMWLVCEDGCVEKAQEELSILLEKYKMNTSDVNPISSLEDVSQISKSLKRGILPKIFLPIDAHIIEYSKLKGLIEKVPETLNTAIQNEIKPYLPIHPKSYRKQWQYDDEAYNFIYDFLSAFTAFNFPEELQQSLNNSRLKVINEHTSTELFDFLMQSANKATFRRFQSMELEERFLKRVEEWKLIKEDNQEISDSKIKSKPKNISLDDEFFK